MQSGYTFSQAKEKAIRDKDVWFFYRPIWRFKNNSEMET
jgi:hypothetical protein